MMFGPQDYAKAAQGCTQAILQYNALENAIRDLKGLSITEVGTPEGDFAGVQVRALLFSRERLKKEMETKTEAFSKIEQQLRDRPEEKTRVAA